MTLRDIHSRNRLRVLINYCLFMRGKLGFAYAPFVVVIIVVYSVDSMFRIKPIFKV